MKTKRIISAILCLIMVLALLPTAALAAAGTVVVVGGMPVTAGINYVSDGAGGIKPADASSTNYNVFYDAGSNTLTLKDANITKNYDAVNLCAAIVATGPLTINLVGNSSVRGDTASYNSFGIFTAADLTIMGNGSLTATGGTAYYESYGVFGSSVKIEGGTVAATGSEAVNRSCGVAGGIVNITGGEVTANGGSVTANSGTASATNCASYGVYGNSVAIEDGTVIATGGTVTATGGYGTTGASYGVYGTSVTMEGGKVTAKGGKASGTVTAGDAGTEIVACGGYSYGLCGSSVNITGGRLSATGNEATATGNKASGYSYGVCGNKSVKLSGGTVTATGGATPCSNASVSSGVYGVSVTIEEDSVVTATGGHVKKGTNYGIFGGNAVDISGGSVLANGGKADDGNSNGVWGFISVKISGGTVTAKGGEAKMASYGVHSPYSLTISGGTVLANGGNAERASYGISSSNDDDTGKITISGGTVTAEGSEMNKGTSCGVNADGSVEVTGGTVTANGGAVLGSPSQSFGLYGGSVDISAGTVTATGGDVATGYSFGVYGVDSVKITDGTVSATGGAAGTISHGVDGFSVDISGGTVTVKGDSAAISLNCEATLSIFADYTAPHTVTASVNKSGIPAVTPADKLGDYKYLRIAPYTPTYVYTPPEVTVFNDPSVGNSTIQLSGSGLAAGDMLITERNPSGSAYKAMLKLADSDDVVATYNIHLKSGSKGSGYAMNLSFDLNEKYAGQAFTLVHQKANGTFEFFHATANANGDLTFGPLYELSPFMLVKGTLAQTLGSGVGIPATGDGSTPALWLAAALLMAVAVLAGIALYKRRRD